MLIPFLTFMWLLLMFYKADTPWMITKSKIYKNATDRCHPSARGHPPCVSIAPVVWYKPSPYRAKLLFCLNSPGSGVSRVMTHSTTAKTGTDDTRSNHTNVRNGF